MARIVVLHSGGLDSSVLLASLSFVGHDVHALSISYGQRHKRELISAAAIAAHFNLTHVIADMDSALRPIFKESKSSQVGSLLQPVPYGHYSAEQMKETIVPNRNMLLIAVAGAYAVSIGAASVAYAAHAGDHAIYPDCRPEFAASTAETLLLATGGEVTLIRPFIELTKADIVLRGASLHVPFALTYSCYEGRYNTHCGSCGTCYERREAFVVAGVPDPTIYTNDPTA